MAILKQMLKHAAPVDDVFRALSDPTRRQMVERPGQSGPADGEPGRPEPLAMSLPAVVQHLGILQSCGSGADREGGRVRTCRLEPARLHTAEEWFAGQRAAWERRLDRLGKYLAETSTDRLAKKSQQHEKKELQMPHQTEMTERRTEHATFVIERTYDAPPSRVFAAWASREAKAKWFAAMEDDDGYVLDFRVDGIETFKGGPDGGPVFL